MTPLTDRQSEVLAFIEGYAAAHGYPPTRREIAKSLHVASMNAVNDHLLALQRKGYIRQKPRMSRGITVLASRPETDPVDVALRAFWQLTKEQRVEFLRRTTVGAAS